MRGLAHAAEYGSVGVRRTMFLSLRLSVYDGLGYPVV
jgi:hypothetical protein